MRDYLAVTDAELARFEDIYSRYKLLHENPEDCRPMIVVVAPPERLPTWEERLADPLVMLGAELDTLRQHLAIGDDRVPSVRVQFGTAQVAAAFGCRIVIPENNLPAAGSHVLERAEDIHQLGMPALDAGWYGKLAEWTAIWKENLPPGVQIQHPDIQSAFNSAHLIRGNDILLDFYDNPADLELLLDRVTDFMLAITKHVKAMISDAPDWFLDWGAMWKGCARISNCSMQMIAPEFYRQFVLPRDIRFFDSIGGGRMHYCGITGAVIDEYFTVPSLTGLDVDCSRHDFFDVCERARPDVVVCPTGAFGNTSEVVQRLLSGDWPKKKNIIVTVGVYTIDEGKHLLEQLRRSIPY